MRQNACLVVNPIIVDGHASLFNCTTAVRTSDSMTPLRKTLTSGLGLDMSGVSLTLCCFVVYSTRRFVLCLTLCHFVLVFFSPFSIAITSLGEERANLSAFFLYVCSICACLDSSFSSSSWCLGRAAVCDCGTPWTFLLPFFARRGSAIGFHLLWHTVELAMSTRLCLL